MKKNLYYRTMYKRENFIKSFLLSFFNLFASGSRLLLEVFIRKNFGERYFRLSHVIRLSVELMALPIILTLLSGGLGSSAMPEEDMFGMSDTSIPSTTDGNSSWMPSSKYILWYLFVVAFIGVSVKHYLDKRRQPSVYDFAKFSLYSGEVQPYLKKLPFFNTDDKRIRECFLEPALFFLIGVVLAIVGQYLGWLLMICSFFYCVAYVADYERGDEFIMDLIDEMISNESLENTFVNDTTDGKTTTEPFRGRRPDDKGLRRQLLTQIIQDDDEVLVAQ